MKRNEKGFGALELIIVLVVIGSVTGISWYAWQSRATNTASPQVPNASSDETVGKLDTASKDLEISAWGIKINNPEGRNLQMHSEKICGAECDKETSYFIKDDNSSYFTRCEYPVGISKLSESSAQDIFARPESYTARHSKKIGDSYYYVFPGSNFQAPCDKLQDGDEQYQDNIRQYILDNIVKIQSV